MRFILLIIMLVGIAQAQVENKIPKYIFNNQLAVGTTGDINSSAYLQVGPSSGGNKGISLPRVANTSSLVGTLVKGLLIYDNSKDSIGYYNGVNWIYPGAPSALKTVADLTARDAIPSEDRYEGMIVYVTSEQKYYSLKGGIDNDDWTELATGGTTIIEGGGGALTGDLF